MFLRSFSLESKMFLSSTQQTFPLLDTQILCSQRFNATRPPPLGNYVIFTFLHLLLANHPSKNSLTEN